MGAPWYQVARKALVATLVAFTVAGGVILAAVADDHVTTTEWVTIALTVAGAIVGPVGVYSARNASQTATPALTQSVLDPHAPPDRDRRPDWWTEPT